MSIINDALKKAQSSLKQTGKSPAAPSRLKPEEPVKPERKPDITNVYEKLYKKQQEKQDQSIIKSHRKTDPKKPSPKLRRAKTWLLISFFAVLYVFICFGGYILIKEYRPFQNILSSLHKSGPSSGFTFANSSPPKKKYKAGELVLNGTSLIDDKRVALINDEIYEIGDMIQGKKVTNIEPASVELVDDQTITTLKVR